MLRYVEIKFVLLCSCLVLSMRIVYERIISKLLIINCFVDRSLLERFHVADAFLRNGHAHVSLQVRFTQHYCHWLKN